MTNRTDRELQLFVIRSLLLLASLLVLASCSDEVATPESEPQHSFTPYEPPDMAGWERQNGVHNVVYSLWGSDPEHVFAAGMNGSILHYSEGTDWSPHFMLPGITWRGLWGPSADTIFAVGGTTIYNTDPDDIGVVYRYAGGVWQQIAGFEHALLWDVWGSAADDVYAVGTKDSQLLIAHFDGESWQEGIHFVIDESPHSAYAVWGSSASDVFVSGSNGDQSYILHFDGQSWQRTDTPSDRINAIWGTGPTDVYACTQYGAILHFDGTIWVEQKQTNRPLNDIAGFATGEVFVCGRQSIYAVRDGIWTEQDIAAPRIGHETYTAMWGSTPDRMLCTGYVDDAGAGALSSLFMSRESGVWQFLHPPAGSEIKDMWGVNDSDVYAVGSMSALLHFNGSRWTPFTIPDTDSWPNVDGLPDYFLSVWASGPDDIYVGTIVGLWHYNGATWTYTDQLDGVWDLWGSGPQDVYALENSNRDGQYHVLHFDGSEWTSIGSFPVLPLTLQGLDSGSIVVAGDEGLCQLYGGVGWTDLNTGESSVYLSAWGDSRENLYLGRYDSGSLLHFDGDSWEDVPLPVHAFTAWLILGNSADNIYVLSDRDENIIHFDGTDWNIDSHEGLNVRGGWSGQNTLFAAGHGRIYHKAIGK